jgi:hypothetical protein
METNAELLDEKLPKHNPSQDCPRCHKSLPMWRLGPEIGGKRMRVWHNFCPASKGDGGIENLCMECKMGDNMEKGKRKK